MPAHWLQVENCIRIANILHFTSFRGFSGVLTSPQALLEKHTPLNMQLMEIFGH